MSKPMYRGLFRLWLVVSVLWIAGMGWYQHQQAKDEANNGVTISLSKDTQFHIDANGVKKENEDTVKRDRLLWVFLPPLALLLLIPVGGWLAAGFKPEGNKG